MRPALSRKPLPRFARSRRSVPRPPALAAGCAPPQTRLVKQRDVTPLQPRCARLTQRDAPRAVLRTRKTRCASCTCAPRSCKRATVVVKLRIKMPGNTFCAPRHLMLVSHLVVSRPYSMMLTTAPEPTVRPPSRIAKRRPSSIAIGWISSMVISTLSPGMHISVPAGSSMTPVTSVVRK